MPATSASFTHSLLFVSKVLPYSQIPAAAIFATTHRSVRSRKFWFLIPTSQKVKPHYLTGLEEVTFANSPSRLYDSLSISWIDLCPCSSGCASLWLLICNPPLGEIFLLLKCPKSLFKTSFVTIELNIFLRTVLVARENASLVLQVHFKFRLHQFWTFDILPPNVWF